MAGRVAGLGLSGAAAAVAGLAGVPAVAAGIVALTGMALLTAAPVLGSYALVALAHLDGLAGLVSRHLPVSLFKLATAAVLAVLLLTLRRNPAAQGRPRPSGPVALAVLFGMWILVSHLLSDNMDAGRDHVTGFLSTMLMVPILALTVTAPAHLRAMALIIAASGAVSAVLVILEAKAGIRIVPLADPRDIAAWQGEVRSAGGSAYNPTTAAHLIAASLMVALTMAAHDRRARLLWLLLAGLCLAGLPLMGARSAILAVGAGGALLAWSLRRHRFFPLGAALFVLAVIAALPFVPAALWERFSVLGDLFDGGNTADRTLLRRLSYNLIGLELLWQHPVAGVGPGAFPTLYAGPEYRWFPGRELDPRQLHNSYLEVGAEMGLVGLAFFAGAVLGACAMALRAGWRATGGSSEVLLAKAFGIAFFTFLVASIFMPNEDNKYMWILMALCAKSAVMARQAGARR